MVKRNYYLNKLIEEKIPENERESNEYNALVPVPGSFKKIMVINDSFHEYTNKEGILVISLEKFLLDLNSLYL